MAVAKRNRGKVLNRLPSNGRGDCPLCDRKRVKLLYARKMESAKIVQVCKFCRDK